MHRVFNEWKKNSKHKLLNSDKILTNDVNKEKRIASDNYSRSLLENFPTSKEQWKFIKKQNNSKQTDRKKNAKLKDGHNVISDEKALLTVRINVLLVLHFRTVKNLILRCLLLFLREINSISSRSLEEKYTNLLTNYQHKKQLNHGI